MESEFESQELKHYLSLVGHKIQILLRKLEGFRSKSYPNQYPITLIELMKRILVQSFDELGRLHERIGIMENSDIADRAWLIHVLAIRYLSHWIEAIQNSSISTTMGGVIDAFNEICNQAQLGTSLIIYPTWQYNFSFERVSDRLASIANRINLDKHANIFDDIYFHYVILTYPYIEDETILGQVLLAHEVGHFIDYAQKWSQDIEEKGILTGIDFSFSADIPGNERENANRLLNQVIQNWIREIVADVLATSILGPAYVLALGDFLFADPYLRSGSREMAISHPPAELRLQLMAQLSKERQWEPSKALPSYKLISKRAKGVYDVVSDIINSYANQELPSIQSIRDCNFSPSTAQWVYSKLLIGLRNVIEFCKTKIDDLQNQKWIFSPEDVPCALALHEYLLHSLTPTELTVSLRRPPSFAAVMNSGWYYLLAQKSNGKFFFFKTDPNEERRPDVINESLISIHQLVAKAIEVQNFQRNYTRQRGR